MCDVLLFIHVCFTVTVKDVIFCWYLTKLPCSVWVGTPLNASFLSHGNGTMIIVKFVPILIVDISFP